MTIWLDLDDPDAGNRLNEIMKRLTGWAAIIAIPCGDRLLRAETPYLGFGQERGFLASVVLIAVIGGGLYLMFKRRGPL